MTPEALHAYLTKCRFSEDVVQGVVLEYLEKQASIRNPKSWGYVAAKRDQVQEERLGRQISRKGGYYEELGPALSNRLTPERYAMARQELAKAMGQPPALKRGRPRDGGPKAWRQDYRALKREPT